MRLRKGILKRAWKLLKATDQEQPILAPMYSLAECGEVFDLLAETIEAESEYAFRIYMVGIVLPDGMVMPITAILN